VPKDLLFAKVDRLSARLSVAKLITIAKCYRI